jgi:hypothetical protein
VSAKVSGLRGTVAALFAAAAILLSATGLYAQATTYSYQGNSFTNFVCGSDGTNPCASYPLCLEEFVKAMS